MLVRQHPDLNRFLSVGHAGKGHESVIRVRYFNEQEKYVCVKKCRKGLHLVDNYQPSRALPLDAIDLRSVAVSKYGRGWKPAER